MPAAAASSFRSRAKCCRVRWPLSPNDGNSHFEADGVLLLLALRASSAREIVRHRLLRRLVERHQAFLVALAAHHDHAGIAPRRRQRQRHQFRDAQARGVEHFQQARQPHRAQLLQRRLLRRLDQTSSPASSRRSTSAMDSTFGSARPRFGPDRIAAGSSLRTRSLSRKRNRCRVDDSLRATLDDLKPRVSRSAR